MLAAVRCFISPASWNERFDSITDPTKEIIVISRLGSLKKGTRRTISLVIFEINQKERERWILKSAISKQFSPILRRLTGAIGSSKAPYCKKTQSQRLVRIIIFFATKVILMNPFNYPRALPRTTKQLKQNKVLRSPMKLFPPFSPSHDVNKIARKTL